MWRNVSWYLFHRLRFFTLEYLCHRNFIPFPRCVPKNKEEEARLTNLILRSYIISTSDQIDH